MRINRTNAATAFETRPNGFRRAGATLAALRASLIRVVEAASIRADRMTRSEVKFVSAVSVRELQTEADSIAQSHRKLDSRIQELNWATDLLS